jgi:transcriptional regulator with XRE-family HTH domain
MNLGERIKAARAHAGMTQAQLGTAVGVSQQMIQKIEGGKADGTGALLDICIVTGVSPRWLARNDGPMEVSQTVGIDPVILGDAMKLLRATDTILGEPADASMNPYRLATAYQLILEEGGTVADGNVIDFTARLAAKLRGRADHGDIGQKDSGTGAAAGGARRAKAG